ncbi:MAG: hypothetical protein NTX72_04645 [Candidatus Uhrbacteria bacterium]|nr:hypothetical protein [Candidatus Uhrbacteria bacterium]
MLTSEEVVAAFQEKLVIVTDFSDYDFLKHSNALSAVQIIIQQTSLELMKRLKAGERLDDIHSALVAMEQLLLEAIKIIPPMFLSVLTANGSSVGLLLFMVEHAMSPIVTDEPS